MAIGIGSAMLGGAAIGAFSSYLGNRQTESMQQDAMNENRYSSAVAWDREYGAYKRRYQDTMADMKKSGLNPILAASSGGFNVGSGPSAKALSAPSGQGSQWNLASSARDIMSAKTEHRKEKLTVEQTATERKKRGLISAQEDNALAEYLNIKQNFNKITAEAKHAIAKRKLTNLEQQKVLQTTAHLKATLVKLTKVAKVYKGPSGTLLTYVQEILKSLNMGVAIVPGLKRAPIKAR